MSLPSVVRNPVRKTEHYFPESNLNIAPRRVGLVKINRSRFSSQIVEHSDKLSVQFEACERVLESQIQVSLVVAVERPVILIETSYSHYLAIVNFYCFHV